MTIVVEQSLIDQLMFSFTAHAQSTVACIGGPVYTPDVSKLAANR